MQQAQVSNPKDYSVVSFHNSTDFRFTPEMGCMYDGRAVNGKTNLPGIDAGETMILPYHVGNQIAKNLAKRVLNISPAATVDAAGVPTGVPIWSADQLEVEKNKFLKELYTEEKPAAQSETDKLMAKVEEYRKLVEEKLGSLEKGEAKPVEVEGKVESKVFLDKQEVIAELEKRNIVFDRRKTKVQLEKLLS